MELYYLEKTGNTQIGSFMMWYRHNSGGYTHDIREARVFNKEEAEEKCKRFLNEFIMWPKEYIDNKILYCINIRDCDYKEALNND
jgi:hypothetical protein